MGQHGFLTRRQLGCYAFASIMQEILELHHWMGDIDRLAGYHGLFGLSGRNHFAEYHLDVGYLLLSQAISSNASRLVSGTLRGGHQHCW